MAFANRLVSYNVIEWELERIATESKAPAGAEGAAEGLDALDLRKEALQIRKEMLQLHVETGQLSFDDYLQTLREAIPREKARSKELKALPGGAKRALDAFKHAKIMSDELAEALAQSGDAESEPQGG